MKAGESNPGIAEQISALEKESLDLKKKLAKLRGELPAEPVSDYTLAGPGGSQIKLSDLFGRHKELIVIHNMGKGCPYCTLWADGFNGVLNHLENRAAFAVVSPDDPEVQKEFASGRGWKFRMYSGKGSSFIDDMGFRREDGGYAPGVSTFYKDEQGQIFRKSSDSFGPGDNYCSVWYLFDLLPEGVNDWRPKFSYQADNQESPGA
jgi:predicted dithiol-disulfide oxidoreductase (DUF899 family)